MDKEFALAFASNWINTWNSHNIDDIFSHYTEDFEIDSPLAKKRLPESNGIIKGKAAVRKYWSLGLSLSANLEFEIIDVLIGVSSITIYYLSQTINKRVVEVMYFNSNLKVYKCVVNYS